MLVLVHAFPASAHIFTETFEKTLSETVHAWFTGYGIKPSNSSNLPSFEKSNQCLKRTPALFKELTQISSKSSKHKTETEYSVGKYGPSTLAVYDALLKGNDPTSVKVEFDDISEIISGMKMTMNKIQASEEEKFVSFNLRKMMIINVFTNQTY
ncbi:hypothetical protein Ciccas_004483 [Cichlidogyrus casuarinus]|uniref:Uncharacterized protein n=1 Tax=Cichlidogyrus casuarinus TaxID=1844966 RepID=A0ABD2QBC6_9PLAT